MSSNNTGTQPQTEGAPPTGGAETPAAEAPKKKKKLSLDVSDVAEVLERKISPS